MIFFQCLITICTWMVELCPHGGFSARRPPWCTSGSAVPSWRRPSEVQSCGRTQTSRHWWCQSPDTRLYAGPPPLAPPTPRANLRHLDTSPINPAKKHINEVDSQQSSLCGGWPVSNIAGYARDYRSNLPPGLPRQIKIHISLKTWGVYCFHLWNATNTVHKKSLKCLISKLRALYSTQ